MTSGSPLRRGSECNGSTGHGQDTPRVCSTLTPVIAPDCTLLRDIVLSQLTESSSRSPAGDPEEGCRCCDKYQGRGAVKRSSAYDAHGFESQRGLPAVVQGLDPGKAKRWKTISQCDTLLAQRVMSRVISSAWPFHVSRISLAFTVFLSGLVKFWPVNEHVC